MSAPTLAGGSQLAWAIRAARFSARFLSDDKVDDHIAAAVAAHLRHHRSVTRALKGACEATASREGADCDYPACGCAGSRRREINGAITALLAGPA